MPQSLEAFALLLLQNEQRAAASITEPVLVWSIPRERELDTEGNELSMGTMTAALSSTRRPREGEAIFFPLKKRGQTAHPFGSGITVGRSDHHDVVVPDGSISRYHAYLQQDAKSGLWRVVDAGSKNGTWLGPLKLTEQMPYPIGDGSRLRFGDVEMIFWSPESFVSFVRQQLEGGDEG